MGYRTVRQTAPSKRCWSPRWGGLARRTGAWGGRPAASAPHSRRYSYSCLITGPYVWNALGLGTTQLFAVTLVYNSERTGEVELGGRRFWFRRVRFPKDPPAEWYVVDLFQNERWMPEDTSRLDEHLVYALRVGRLDRARLQEMASEYARPAVRARLMRAIAASAA